MMRLQDRVALVTGGGTGIGRAVALAFAREGARVGVNYSRSREPAENVVREIEGQGGCGIAIAADVSRDEDVRSMVRQMEDRFGRMDYLVNNAGWTTRVAHERMDELTDEVWDRTLHTNLRGAFYCVRAAVPLLRRQPGAGIVNITSAAGVSGRGSSMAYAASKGGLMTMTRSLARALAPEIRVNSVAPGLVRTGFGGWGEDQCLKIEAVTPLRRLATAEDIGTVVVFLAADALAITGETLVADGGLTPLGIL